MNWAFQGTQGFRGTSVENHCPGAWHLTKKKKKTCKKNWVKLVRYLPNPVHRLPNAVHRSPNPPIRAQMLIESTQDVKWLNK